MSTDRRHTSCIFNLFIRGNGIYDPISCKIQKTTYKLCRNYTQTSVSKFFLQRHVAVLKMQGVYLDTVIIGHTFCNMLSTLYTK